VRQCGWFTVIGDENELRERAVQGWDQFDGHTPHRPFIDAVKIAAPPAAPSPAASRTWATPGSMPASSPFSTMQLSDRPEYWEKWFPADWISESFPGQFRNWFYSLLAMSTVLTGRPPFLSL
jgi:isoleucyl-tRNA synthetase